MKRPELSAAPTLRCAIYTRKSSEEGLEQGFNSLHAQREACEAYVLSQAGEGWKALATTYDDGGWSGGNMERPGLQQLLADIDARKVDVVVVYKVDRLTRSLTDFAKIVERFDDQGISFVSVTQAFNTTSSMGRLTLNVLLSFAQFEREVTGERIRDKIAASKAKGMWMGGNLPLGYDPPPLNGERTLILNPAEAETVRLIFAKYLELRSVHDLKRWLAGAGVKSKARTTKAGKIIGDQTFNRGALFHLLKNRVYIGEIVHKERSFPAKHIPIIDQAMFDAVQTLLAAHAVHHRERPVRAATAPLKGKIFDADGGPMSPTFTHRERRIHRYYVSAKLQQGGADAGLSLRRVPAQALEDLVLDRLQAVSRAASSLGWSTVKPRLKRVEIHGSTVQVVVIPEKGTGELQAEVQDIQARLEPTERVGVDHDDPALLRIVLPVRMKLRGGRTWLLAPEGGRPTTQWKTDPGLVRGLRSAHQLMSRLNLKPKADGMNAAQSPANTYERCLLQIALLAPDIQQAILEGRHPQALTMQALMQGDLPLDWEDQRRTLGFN